MNEYIIVTLKINNNSKSLGYGKQLRAIQENRMWERATGGIGISFSGWPDLEKLQRDKSRNIITPTFSSYDAACKYFAANIDGIVSHRSKDTKFSKFFTRITTVEKFINFDKVTSKPYDFYDAKSVDDDLALNDLLGPRLTI